MKGLFTGTGLVIAGLLAGWWLRDLVAGSSFPFTGESHTATDAIFSTSTTATPPSSTDSPTGSPLTALELTRLPDAARFGELLEQGDYEGSIAYYESALQAGENYRALLKPRLVDYLNARVQTCADEGFVDLVPLWLDSYYEDIEVLLLLAEHQRFCNSAGESARTLQIARTYALRPGQRASVAAAVSRLVAATEERLSGQGEWIELLGFYEFLETIELDTNASQLRRASLYERVGEVQRSRDLLLELQENDDGLDDEWAAALKRQLANSAPAPAADGAPGHDIALARRGNHYLVPAVINGATELALIIDTGASVTTLSKRSFARIEGTGLRYLGTQLFNTPNGITRGEVYRAASLQLGDSTLRDLDIAVLDFATRGDFDGLLGMNVLRNYRFNIDQDRAILHITPRL
jgi:clan AA aspartic protease (TIGR02281 family)